MFFKNKKEKKDPMTRCIPLLPLRDMVVFPAMIVPLFVGRKKSIIALEKAYETDNKVLLVTQREAQQNDPGPDDIYTVGTLVDMLQMIKSPDGTVKLLVEGIVRMKITNFVSSEDFFEVEGKEIFLANSKSEEVDIIVKSVIGRFKEYVKSNTRISSDAVVSITNTEEPGRLSDVIVTHLGSKVDEKQDILETFDIVERLTKLSNMLDSEMKVVEIEKTIRSRVKNQMEKSQKEYYLNEQMKAIQKELGTKDDHKAELVSMREKIEESKMGHDAEEKALKEFKRLEMMPPMSAEGVVIQNYIDWLVSIPWHKKSKENKNIKEAERILNEEHFGLEKVKERIIEFLAVRQLVKKVQGPILCLVGPPGVGKTSLAKSVAKAMGRKFVRLSLGGIRDEAEIRGHRRTYIGAMPGRIIQSMKKAKVKNPVFLLDEIDKMSTDFRGDPSSALLEVLDPEQNKNFSDHYLEVDYDLSEVMFISTANAIHHIPHPLRDRMEVITLSGYTENEKVEILNRFLVPKELKANGVKSEQIKISGNTPKTIIQSYTKEAGVRELQRKMGKIFRKVAKKIVEGESENVIPINKNTLTTYLGAAQYRYTKAKHGGEIGKATGLAWTEVGGEILATETTIIHGRGKLTLTGQLGEVMQESAQAAYTYIRSIVDKLNVNYEIFQIADFHIHVPEGAIPKDGPSAGTALASSLASALSRRPVKSNVAMTGEITLRGMVLPIGGLKEKVLAAHRSGIDTIIFPKENEKDLPDIPKSVRSKLTFHMVEDLWDVLEIALEPKPVDNIWADFVDRHNKEKEAQLASMRN